MTAIKNVGQADRIARFVLGVALIFAPLMNLPPIWSGTFWAYAAMLVGAILVVTAFVRICPIYRLLGIDTCRI